MGRYFHLYENVSSVGPFDGPQYHLAPRWAFHLQTLFMGLVLFTGTPLNLIVLYVAARYKKLQVPLNFILINISAAGLVFVSFSVSLVFVSTLKGFFFLGQTVCALESAVGSVAGLVTAWSLAVLSFERYLIICKPFGAFQFTGRHAAAAVAFTWMMGVGCAAPPFFGWSRYIPEGLGCSCGPDWYTHSEEFGCSSYTVFLMVTCFIAPLTIIILSYCQLLGALRAVASQQAGSSSTQRAEQEVTRMVVLMVASYVACYGPYALAALYFSVSPRGNHDYRLVTVPALFSKSSCVYNPLIYAFLNKQFHGCIVETLTGRRTDETSEASSKTEVSTSS